MPEVELNLLGEKLDRGARYEFDMGSGRIPIILRRPEVLERIEENEELTTPGEYVGGQFITRGYESIDLSDGPSLPFLNRQFQIVNNAVAFLPDTQVVVDDTRKKKRVFNNDEWKVLTSRGIRPITKNVPGTFNRSDELADVLTRYGWSVAQWKQIYNTGIDRFGFGFTGIRAGVSNKKLHARRQIYGIRCPDKETAYHISAVFNSLVYSILQLSAYERIGFAPKNIKANVQLRSLREAPIPDPDMGGELAELQEDIETTIKDNGEAFDDRMERVEELKQQRELLVCKRYGLMDGSEDPPEALMEEADMWELVLRRFTEMEE